MLYLLGYATGIGAANAGCSDGPLVLHSSAALTAVPAAFHWQALIRPPESQSTQLIARGRATTAARIVAIVDLCRQLADQTARLTQQKKSFVVLGGDHSCAIGTWSGVSRGLGSGKPLGLVWIDAHMDSHTLDTTQSGNPHGMPLACLLGRGDAMLTGLGAARPVLQPQHVCLIGVRSYEPAEATLLQQLGVRIFFMPEIKQRGLAAVMAEAHEIVTAGTEGYGISLDIDGIDPRDAPGTGAAEPDGLSATELLTALRCFADDKRRLGLEIVEFDPHRDIDGKTEHLIPELLTAICIK